MQGSICVCYQINYFKHKMWPKNISRKTAYHARTGDKERLFNGKLCNTAGYFDIDE